jgi:hypothetical protein
VVLLKWRFAAHTSVNVLLEKEGKYAGIYSCILAMYCFEYSTARMECSIRRNISHSAHYSKEKRRKEKRREEKRREEKRGEERRREEKRRQEKRREER